MSARLAVALDNERAVGVLVAAGHAAFRDTVWISSITRRAGTRRNLAGLTLVAIPKDAIRVNGMTVVIFAVVILLLLYLFSRR